MCNVHFNGGCSGIDHSLCLTLTLSFLRQRVLDQSGQAGYSLTFTLPADISMQNDLYSHIIFIFCYSVLCNNAAVWSTVSDIILVGQGS